MVFLVTRINTPSDWLIILNEVGFDLVEWSFESFIG